MYSTCWLNLHYYLIGIYINKFDFIIYIILYLQIKTQVFLQGKKTACRVSNLKCFNVKLTYIQYVCYGRRIFSNFK